MQKFCILASLCSRADWFESHFVRNPKDRFSRNEAHIFLLLCENEHVALTRSELSLSHHFETETGLPCSV